MSESSGPVFHEALCYQARTFAMASSASIVATGGLVAGIVSVLG